MRWCLGGALVFGRCVGLWEVRLSIGRSGGLEVGVVVYREVWWSRGRCGGLGRCVGLEGGVVVYLEVWWSTEGVVVYKVVWWSSDWEVWWFFWVVWGSSSWGRCDGLGPCL